jgi:hypothetical protein
MAHLRFPLGVVVVQIANNKEVSPMKRVTIAIIAFIAMLAITAPLVLADNDPPPSGAGGCSGPDCK